MFLFFFPPQGFIFTAGNDARGARVVSAPWGPEAGWESLPGAAPGTP